VIFVAVDRVELDLRGRLLPVFFSSNMSSGATCE